MRATTRQRIHVYGILGRRMDWLVDEITPGGVKLSAQANFPTWWGGPSRINQLQWHDCAYGEQVVYRMRASSVLPIPRTVTVTVRPGPPGGVDLEFELPFGWTTQVEDLPAADASE